MAIWIDDLENETATGWRATDVALVASLALVAVLQVGVVVYATDMGRSIFIADAAVKSEGVPAMVEPSRQFAEPAGTEFAAAPVNPSYDGTVVGNGIAFWFGQDSAQAHVELVEAANPMVAPNSYKFAVNGADIDLYDVPVDYRDPVTTDDEDEIPTASLATFDAPVMATPAQTEIHQLAVLRDYMGEAGLAEMSQRCAALAGETYKYDGGMMELCRKVRATL